MLELRKMNLQDIKEQWEYVTALPRHENGLTNPYEGITFEEYETTVLPELMMHENPVGMPEWFVSETYYYLWDEQVLVGEYRIRHYLTETLKVGAGHIGYSIKKEYRGKGYGTKGLAMVLDIAHEIVPEDNMMELDKMELIRIGADDVEELWKMQVEAFASLYEKCQDTDTSPVTEKIDKVQMRLNQSFTYFYFIVVDGEKVGAIRVVDKKEEGKAKRISPIFIMKQHRNNGYAQKAMKLVEEIHGISNWDLDTILQEKVNCHLYEKNGISENWKDGKG